MRRHCICTISALSLLFCTHVFAQKTIIQTNFTADPAPMVDRDTVFLYTSHDEDYAQNFEMKNWLLHTSTDMVNWTNCGQVASLECFNKWFHGTNGAWALQVIRRDNKYYMYCPLHGSGIGVLVSDSPYGPFTDPIGKPLVNNGWECIDPTVFIDDDGQAYLYWGNPELWMVKLNKDMISYSGDIVQFPKINDYQEAPWIYKREGKYYMAFASTCCPEGIGYAMGDSPFGPWEYKGHIMKHYPESSGNHPGIIDYKGKSYVFGFSNELLRETLKSQGQEYKHSERRSVHASAIEFREDGTIVELPFWTSTKLEQIEPLNPYRRVEAETMAWGFGLKIERDGDALCTAANHRDIYVTDINSTESLTVRGVDFGDGAAALRMRVASAGAGGTIEVRLKSKTGKKVGTLNIGHTGGERAWKDEICLISGATGVNDLVFVFKGSDKKAQLFNLDYWEFFPKTEEHKLLGINAYTSDYQLDTHPIEGVSVVSELPLTVKAIYSDGTEEELTDYELEYDPERLTIADGKITALTYGPATVTVKKDGMSDEVKLVVNDFEAEYTVESLTSNPAEISVLLGGETTYTLNALFRNGNLLDVTTSVTPTVGDRTIATVSKGKVKGLTLGETSANFSYKGKMGEAQTLELPVKVVCQDPYTQIEAEAYSEAQGTAFENGSTSNGGVHVANIDNGCWLKFCAVDFGEAGAQRLTTRVATCTSGGNIEARLDSPTGTLIGTVKVTNKNNSWTSWYNATAKVTGATGIHDLYLVFTGGDGWLFNIDSFRFTPVSTGIDDITIENSKLSNSKLFDLSGRRVPAGQDEHVALPNGVYIRDGKKVVK